MDDFFAVWEAAKDKFDLERKVHIDFDEAYIRITSGKMFVMKVEGSYEEVEEMYQTAAYKLLEWIRRRS